MKKIYGSEFDQFLENIYTLDGVEGLANSIPFISSPFVVTHEGMIVAANNSFIQLLGYEKSELYGKNAIDVTYLEDREKRISFINEDIPQVYNLRIVTKGLQLKHCIVYPYIFKTAGKKYRLEAFIDNSDFIVLQEKQIEALKHTAVALARTIETRDPYTSGHMSRTATIAVEIAKLIGIGDESIDSIFLGASIHDIGKIAVPIEILIKPSELNIHERGLIRTHPDVGFNILSGVEFVETVKQIIRFHHEAQDGSGYPTGIKGDAIPIEVAVVTVADCLDAISGVRPYRKANTFKNAIEIMKQESYKYEPAALLAAENLVESGYMSKMEFVGY
jgi:HD-GYP domain-containing protein (c-di-GMP phosphodiesterase class II)